MGVCIIIVMVLALVIFIMIVTSIKMDSRQIKDYLGQYVILKINYKYAEGIHAVYIGDISEDGEYFFSPNFNAELGWIPCNKVKIIGKPLHTKYHGSKN